MENRNRQNVPDVKQNCKLIYDIMTSFKFPVSKNINKYSVALKDYFFPPFSLIRFTLFVLVLVTLLQCNAFN